MKKLTISKTINSLKNPKNLEKKENENLKKNNGTIILSSNDFDQKEVSFLNQNFSFMLDQSNLLSLSGKEKMFELNKEWPLNQLLNSFSNQKIKKSKENQQKNAKFMNLLIKSNSIKVLQNITIFLIYNR